MTTATLPQPKSAKAARIPTNNMLQLHHNFAGDASDFYAEVFEWENDVSGGRARFQTKLDHADSTPCGEFFRRRKPALLAEWLALTAAWMATYVALRWRKRDELMNSGPEHAKRIQETKTLYEQTRDEEIEALTASGVNRAMPAANRNPSAAAQQLRAEADRKEWVAAAKGDWNAAVEADRVRLAQIEAVPSYGSCSITWPAFEGVAGAVAELIGLPMRTEPARPAFSVRARRIARDFALENSPLLPSHVNAIEALDKFAKDSFHPLQFIAESQLPNVRNHVQQLPKTNAVLQFLHNTRNGLPRSQRNPK